MLEKTLESPLDCKEIQPVSPKGNQSWIFIGRTDAEAETPVLWPPNAKNSLIGKDPDARKDWRREEKGTTEDEMVGWHHRLDGHEFAQAPVIGDGRASLACCSPCGRKESDTTERLNWTELDSHDDLPVPPLFSQLSYLHKTQTLTRSKCPSFPIQHSFHTPFCLCAWCSLLIFYLISKLPRCHQYMKNHTNLKWTIR